MAKKMIEIGGRLHDVSTDHVVAGADEIFDDAQNKKQSVVNQKVDAEFNTPITGVKARLTKAEGDIVENREEINRKQFDVSAAVIDAVPTEDSENLVRSGAIYEAYAHQVYLGADGTTDPASFDPQADTIHKGAQVLSDVEKKQVRANLGFGNGDVDAEPIAGSNNLVKSGAVAEAYGFYKSLTNTATQGANFYIIFYNINIPSGKKFKVKATGDVISSSNNILNLHVNSASGTSLGNITINGNAVEITAPSDIIALVCYRNSNYVTASGSVTVDILIEGTVINANLADIRTNLSTVNGQISTLNTNVNNVTSDAAGTKANIGYYVCSSLGGSANKNLSITDYKVIEGASIKVKMEHANTKSGTIYLDINSGVNKKQLYYEGAAASNTNTWADNEVVEIFYYDNIFHAYKVDIRMELEAGISQNAADIAPIKGQTKENTVTAVIGTAFNNTISISIPQGNLFSVEITKPEGSTAVFTQPIEIFRESTANKIGQVSLGYPTQIFVATTAITKIIAYAGTSRFTTGGAVKMTVRNYGNILSEALLRDDIICTHKKLISSSDTSSYSNTHFRLSSKLLAGEYFVVKCIDATGALNGARVGIYKTSTSSANYLGDVYQNNVSNIFKAEGTIEDMYFVVYKPTGGYSGDGNYVYFEVHKASSYDALFPSIKNLSASVEDISNRVDNIGSSAPIVSIENPHWSQFWDGSPIYSSSQTLKGIYVKFDSITIYTGKTKVTKTWTDLKTDLPAGSPVFYNEAGDNTPDCLLVQVVTTQGGTVITGYYILYYDISAGKFKMTLDNSVISSPNYVILAYSRDGKYCGEICQQQLNVRTDNQNQYLTEVNAKYLRTLRTKEMELLEAKDYFTFGWCSDVHYPVTENHGGPINVTNAVMADLDNYIGFDAILNTGDNMLYGSKVKRQGLDALQQTFRTIDLDKFVISVGNHDYNSVGDGGITTNKEDWMIVPSELETLFFRRVKTTSRPDGKLYYYRDFDEKKVRIISLDTQDVPFEFDSETGNITYDPMSVQGMSEAQIEWLANTALDLSSKGTDANNWKIIVAMHVPLYSDHGSAIENASVVKSILKAFVNRSSSATYTYTDSNHDGIFSVNLTLDFTDAKGKLIAVIAGHTHKDVYYNDAGFNFIQIQNSYNNNINMLPETYDEFAIDVVILDDVQEKIILKRFGHYNVSDNPDGDREYPYDVTT